MTCRSCGRDKSEFFFCCDSGPRTDRKRDDVAFQKALDELLGKKWAEVFEVNGVEYVQLTELGHFVIRTEEAAAAAWN